jgi:hypothetical protein
MTQRKRHITGRFAASGAVTRPTGSANLQVLWLVSSVVEAPPAASRLDVTCNAGATQRVSSGITSTFQTIRGVETNLSLF